MKKLRRIGLSEAAVSLGEVCGDRDGGAIQLVDEKAVAAREAFGECSNFNGEVDGLLVDLELLEHEGQD